MTSDPTISYLTRKVSSLEKQLRECKEEQSAHMALLSLCCETVRQIQENQELFKEHLKL